MKPIQLVFAIAFLAGPAAYADGMFLFSVTVRDVWDDTKAPPKVTTTNTFDVSFLIGSGTPVVDSIAPAIPTNNMPPGNVVTYYAANAWNDIFNDPNFHLATNGSVTVVATASSVNGGWVYNGANSFSDPYTTGGNTYTVYAIGWLANNGATTPQQAAALDEPVGWSTAFSYTTGNPSGLPPTPPDAFNQKVSPFGVAGIVPEPGTIALAGMGIASLLAFRRRNSK